MRTSAVPIYGLTPFAGAIYHVMNRGDRREAIFANEQVRECFLLTLSPACQKTSWQVHACCWCRYPLYLTPKARPAWQRVDRWLCEWRIAVDSPAGRQVFAQAMEGRRREKGGEEFRAVERGWRLGDEAFRRELLEQVSNPPSAIHYGETVQEAVAVRAEHLLAGELAWMGRSERDLRRRRKGDRGKVHLAVLLRARTTMPLAWKADRLKMGSRGYLTWLLQHNGDDTNNHDAAQPRLL